MHRILSVCWRLPVAFVLLLILAMAIPIAAVGALIEWLVLPVGIWAKRNFSLVVWGTSDV